MLETIFILLLIFAILLIIFAIEYERNSFWNLVSIVLAIPLWFILGLANMEIERPYELYNISSGNIETGIHTVTSPISPYLTYFFMGVGLLLFIYLFAMVYDKYINYKER